MLQEWYDYNMSLVRYDYKPNPINVVNFGLDTLSEVHDWNEGRHRGVYLLLSNLTWLFILKAYISSPKEYFDDT